MQKTTSQVCYRRLPWDIEVRTVARVNTFCFRVQSHPIARMDSYWVSYAGSHRITSALSTKFLVRSIWASGDQRYLCSRLGPALSDKARPF